MIRPFGGRLCRAVITAAALALAAAAIPAEAGTVIELRTEYFESGRADESAEIFFDDNCVRFDAMQGGEEISLIFRSDLESGPVCWVIDFDENTYFEVNEKTVKEIQDQIAKAKVMMEQQMQNIPPEQRASYKKMVEEKMGNIGRTDLDIEFKEVASGVQVNAWRCTQYESYVDGAKHEDVWAAPAEELGLTAADLQVLRGMSDLFAGISPETNAFFQVGKEGKAGFEGFPVLVVEYLNGEKHEKSEVKSVADKNLRANTFELPKGATRRALPGM
jgi:hypothetical protein